MRHKFFFLFPVFSQDACSDRIVFIISISNRTADSNHTGVLFVTYTGRSRPTAHYHISTAILCHPEMQ